MPSSVASLRIFFGVAAREKDDRGVCDGRSLAHGAYELESVEPGKARVGDDHVRSDRVDLLQAVLGVGRGRHDVSGLAQADLEHAEAERIGIDQKQLFHGRASLLFSVNLGDSPDAHVRRENAVNDYAVRAACQMKARSACRSPSQSQDSESKVDLFVLGAATRTARESGSGWSLAALSRNGLSLA